MKPRTVASTTYEVAASGTLENPDGTNAHHFYNAELQPILTAGCGSCHTDDSKGFVPDYDAIEAANR